MHTAAPQVPLVARTEGAEVSLYTTSHEPSPCTMSRVSVSPLGGGYLADRTLHVTTSDDQPTRANPVVRSSFRSVQEESIGHM